MSEPLDHVPAGAKPVPTLTVAILYFGADDSFVGFHKLTLVPSLEMLDAVKAAAHKRWPDGATVAQVFTGRDRIAAEYRR